MSKSKTALFHDCVKEIIFLKRVKKGIKKRGLNPAKWQGVAKKWILKGDKNN